MGRRSSFCERLVICRTVTLFWVLTMPNLQPAALQGQAGRLRIRANLDRPTNLCRALSGFTKAEGHFFSLSSRWGKRDYFLAELNRVGTI